ncbi:MULTISPECIES: lysophospholipid acyltransferase family protein [unclassified Methylophaga]|uniref:lysophospholipid acyltransferase family protein n=1 Tax=unclassified Methylophaga TaxID=2629249 RepID=UPI000C99683A|nr:MULTISPECIES: lysophospholipid acyltransferase family protein [unclassified Methylophaga]MBN45768.1 1-acyl-sn-glycerol-3-phosphate acyltransferase [Methylophaga sp.]|tara:strand:+ start:95850 stop:96620 length:771 start_codon:yes stop_codon:yes gene_type:complete
MTAFLDRSWRLFATALSFFLFGLGSVFISLLLAPILMVLPGTSVQKQRRGKACIHHVFRCYIGLMKLLGVLSYEVHGRDKLQGAKLILANHPSLIDVIFLISLVPNANCVVKKALLRNPFTYGPVKAAGYILNDDSVDVVIEAAQQAFDRGDALIIFPEGTRSKPGQRLSLKRGAANVAVRTKVDVTPVIIDCQPLTLTKGEPWYRIPQQRPHFVIRIEPPMPIATYIDNVKPAMAARNLTADLTGFFNKEIGLHE